MKKNIIIICSFIFCVFVPGVGFAQLMQELDTLLTLQEAIDIGLEKNYELEISRKNKESALQNFTIGNAGFLPTVSAYATKDWNVQSSEIEFTDRAPVVGKGIKSNTLNAGASLRWVLFDGTNMFNTYKRLEAVTILEDENLKANVSQLIGDIVVTYFNHSVEQARLQVWQNTLEISESRMRIAKDRYEVGKASKLEYLSAQVDYNADMAEYLRQKENLYSTKVNLNLLLGIDRLDYDFNTVDTIRVEQLLGPEDYPYSVMNNPLYKAVDQQLYTSKLAVKEVRSERWPELSANLAYNYNTRNSPQPVNPFSPIYSQADGFTYGLSATINIFDGFNVNRRIQTAKISSEVASIRLRQLEQSLQAEKNLAIIKYKSAMERLALEQENLIVAKENADIALERYQLGVATALQLREAQRNALQAELRLIDTAYEIKVAETNLLNLTGQIIPSYLN